MTFPSLDTVFVEGPGGIWGEFRTPPGKNYHTGFNIFECEFLGVFYRVAPPPLPRVKPLSVWAKFSYEAREEHKRAEEERKRSLEEHLKILKRKDIRMTLVPGPHGPSFITLVPLDD